MAGSDGWAFNWTVSGKNELELHENIFHLLDKYLQGIHCDVAE